VAVCQQLAGHRLDFALVQAAADTVQVNLHPFILT
jgi:hypothetical protein